MKKLIFIVIGLIFFSCEKEEVIVEKVVTQTVEVPIQNCDPENASVYASFATSVEKTTHTYGSYATIGSTSTGSYNNSQGVTKSWYINGTYKGTGNYVTHTVSKNGTYSVVLTIIVGDCTYSTSQEVVVDVL